jgi:hypothetical protein
MRKQSRTLLCGLALLVACGPAVSREAAPTRPAPSGVLWLDTDEGLLAVEVSGGTMRMELPDAIASQDFSEVYSTRFKNRRTTLVRWGTDEARRLSSMVVGGRFVANVVGPGGLVAMTEPRSPGATPWLPDGRASTTVVVADPNEGTKRTYQLRGNFEPEAFSTNGRRLYTIEYIPPSAPNRYQVRILNLATGKVSAIRRLKAKAPGQMRGTGRMQVFAPEGHELYTLYTRQGPNYAHGAPADSSRARNHAFIHLLSLEGGWAHCIDLPLPFGLGSATASSIDISRDGRELYVSDWTNGAVAVVDPSAVKVLRTARLPLGDADNRTFAAAASTGLLYLAGNDAVATVDTASMKVVDRWQMDGEVAGLEVSPDGRTVYVAVAGAIAMMDAVTGRQIGAVPVGAVNDILHTG